MLAGINFTAIDFETAHALIPCEIGICVVRDGAITERVSHLIKPSCFPYMNRFNQQIHGISTEMIAECDTFDSLWYNKLRGYFEKELIVAHNASFDVGVLKSALRVYDIQWPRFNYICSCKVAREVWREMPSYSLGRICNRLGIKLNHHRAGDDAYGCAELLLRSIERVGVSSVEELARISKVTITTFKK